MLGKRSLAETPCANTEHSVRPLRDRRRVAAGYRERDAAVWAAHNNDSTPGLELVVPEDPRRDEFGGHLPLPDCEVGRAYLP